MTWHIFHRWESVSVRPMTRVYATRQGKELAAEPITEVLQRCECGALRTKTLSGEWKLEDIKS